jgi:hypothetical protein
MHNVGRNTRGERATDATEPIYKNAITKHGNKTTTAFAENDSAAFSDANGGGIM